MTRVRFGLLAIGLALTLAAGPAVAAPVSPPRMVSRATAGPWAMLEQVTKAPHPPVGCLAVQREAAVGLRDTGAGPLFMMANAHWDLPARLAAAFRISIGHDAFVLPAVTITSDTAAASLSAGDFAALTHAMQAGSASGQVMRVTLFPGMPVRVALTGFSAILPAFGACRQQLGSSAGATR